MLSVCRILLLLMFLAFSYRSGGQDTIAASLKTKSGLNLGALPSVLFNSDLGFQYGALANLYQYGNGDLYPDYRWSLYGEVARTTKGGGINQLNFDSKYLLPFGVRITADLSYLTQQALDFYGFNGYESRYNIEWETKEDEAYISRMFYRIERKLLRLEASFQKPISGSRWNLLAGVSYLDLEIGDVDIEALNKGRAEEDKLPDTISLFGLYKGWGLISDADQEGGHAGMFKAGIVYDTRDNEPNPMNGIWAEAVVAAAPSFLMDREGFAKLALIYRQYFTLKRNVFSIACRMGYQGTIAGSVPWYLQSYMINSMTRSTTVDGLGGGRSLRGILRNRVVGDAVGYANLEFRWKIVRTYWLRQNFYFALSGFLDSGRVLKGIDIDRSKAPEEVSARFFDASNDDLHTSVGAGFHIAMNENFVFAVDYGHALDNRDGLSGIYIGLNWLF